MSIAAKISVLGPGLIANQIESCLIVDLEINAVPDHLDQCCF